MARVRCSASDRRTYDLVILDVMLPDIDGFGVGRQVPAMGLKIPVLSLMADRHPAAPPRARVTPFLEHAVLGSAIERALAAGRAARRATE